MYLLMKNIILTIFNDILKIVESRRKTVASLPLPSPGLEGLS